MRSGRERMERENRNMERALEIIKRRNEKKKEDDNKN